MLSVPVNNSSLTGTLSNVRRCWLAMPLGAGVLSWVLACRTIEKNTQVSYLFIGECHLPLHFLSSNNPVLWLPDIRPATATFVRSSDQTKVAVYHYIKSQYLGGSK